MGYDMAKTIVPVKMVIDLNANGSIKEAVLQYKLSENGSTLNRSYSVSVKNGLTMAEVEAVIGKAVASAQQSEGL